MSIAKITTVTKAKKDQGKCGRCGKELPAGAPYRWFTVGFRSSYKHRRCMERACDPKNSELESSKLSEVYAVQENFDIAGCTTINDIEEAVHAAGDEIRTVADEYTEASVNPNTGMVFNTEAEERGQTLESSADELDSWAHDEEFERCDAHDGSDEDVDPEDFEVGDEGPKYECKDCAEMWEQFIEDARVAAAEAVDNIDLP